MSECQAGNAKLLYALNMVRYKDVRTKRWATKGLYRRWVMSMFAVFVDMKSIEDGYDANARIEGAPWIEKLDNRLLECWTMLENQMMQAMREACEFARRSPKQLHLRIDEGDMSRARVAEQRTRMQCLQSEAFPALRINGNKQFLDDRMPRGRERHARHAKQTTPGVFADQDGIPQLKDIMDDIGNAREKWSKEEMELIVVQGLAEIERYDGMGDWRPVEGEGSESGEGKCE